MFKNIIIWGGVSFCWQIIAGIILPRIFIFELGNEVYGKLSFFFILLNPVFWFDFSGNINKGLLAVLPGLDPKTSHSEITARYSGTLIWWLIVWGAIVCFAWIAGIRFFSWISLAVLMLLPFAVTGVYRLVIDWYSKQQYSQIYLFQTLASIVWVIGCWVLILYLPAKKAILLSTLGIAILGLLYCFTHSHPKFFHQIKFISETFNPIKIKDTLRSDTQIIGGSGSVQGNQETLGKHQQDGKGQRLKHKQDGYGGLISKIRTDPNGNQWFYKVKRWCDSDDREPEGTQDD